MKKDKVIDALNAIFNGSDAEDYHDELEVVIAILVNASDKEIAAAWEEIKTD